MPAEWMYFRLGGKKIRFQMDPRRKLGLDGSFWLHGFSAIQVRKFWVGVDPMSWELVNRRRHHNDARVSFRPRIPDARSRRLESTAGDRCRYTFD